MNDERIRNSVFCEILGAGGAINVCFWRLRNNNELLLTYLLTYMTVASNAAYNSDVSLISVTSTSVACSQPSMLVTWGGHVDRHRAFNMQSL